MAMKKNGGRTTGKRTARKAGNGRSAGRGNGARGNGARKPIEREIAQAFGFTPDFYSAVPTPVLEHAWGIQRDLELAETSLDGMTKALIGLAVASHMKCPYAVYYHAKGALASGATKEQLREAVMLGGFTAMMSNAVTGAELDMDRFRREVDRAFASLREEKQPRARARAI